MTALVALVALSACTEEGMRPLAPGQAVLSSVAGGSDLETTGNHLVVMEGPRLPANLGARVAALGGQVEAAYTSIGVAVVSGLGDFAASQLEAANDVRFVSPDYLLPLELPEVAGSAEAAGGEPSSGHDPGGAFFFARQWHLHAISAPDAWAAGRLGSADVTVAILDTGLDYLHADLAGLVDLDRSVSFVPSDDALVAAAFPGAHPVADLHWHGTHVGATVSSNAVAAAGVTAKTTLVGVKVCNVNGSCPTSGVLAGIMYASDVGADVLNLSLGGLFQRSANPGFVSVIHRALAHANRNGAVLVVAAGNANTDLDRDIHPVAGHVPSLYASYCDGPTTVCVSATGPATAASLTGPWTGLDTRAEYSNFGRSAIDVAAPGGRSGQIGGGGAVWAACSGFSLVVPICQTGTFIIGASGTSMASPHAAGVAALLVDRLGRQQAVAVATRLHQTADDIGAPGVDPFFGKGRVNAARAAGL